MAVTSKLIFPYFEGPEHEISGLLPGQRQCSLCGAEDRCFDLALALGKRRGAGCVACLRQDRFGFFHITQAGYLDEGGLTWYGAAPIQPTRVLLAGLDGVRIEPVEPYGSLGEVAKVPSEEHIAALRRTPSFPTWNEVEWPIHCQDFMIYLGSWTPREVASLAARLDMAPQECFTKLAGSEHARVWTGQPDWAITFHVFRCTGCADHRGLVDFS